MTRPVKTAVPPPVQDSFVPSLVVLNDSLLDRVKRAIAKVR